MNAEAANAHEQYQKDRILVESYTGLQITREQFDSYCEQFTIADLLGTDQETYRKYLLSPDNLPDLELGQSRVALDILMHLAEADVVFEIEDVREVILEAARNFGRHNLQIMIPQPYRFALELEVRRIRNEAFDQFHPAA